MKLFWTAPSEQDLFDITAYYLAHSPKGSRSIFAAIRGAAAALPDFPRMGRETGQNERRELVIPHTPFIIVYRIKEPQIEVLRVFHGTQSRPPA